MPVSHYNKIKIISAAKFGDPSFVRLSNHQLSRMQPKLGDSPFLRDGKVREGDPLTFNLVPRKALVKHGVFPLFTKDPRC